MQVTFSVYKRKCFNVLILNLGNPHLAHKVLIRQCWSFWQYVIGHFPSLSISYTYLQMLVSTNGRTYKVPFNTIRPDYMKNHPSYFKIIHHFTQHMLKGASQENRKQLHSAPTTLVSPFFLQRGNIRLFDNLFMQS